MCSSDLFLPPYAPDLNPDEFVWQHTKTNGVAKQPLRKGESLRQRVTQDLAKVKASRKLVRSFFGASRVAYAKSLSEKGRVSKLTSEIHLAASSGGEEKCLNDLT